MIEKLELPSSARLVCGKDYDIAFKYIKQTVNQLVDAVNGILAAQEQYATIYKEDIVPMLTPENEEPADPYAEQHKWIGKLCRFRDKDYKDDQWDYGLLQAVEKAETAHIWKTGCFKHNLGHWYDFCEPVKPDDDIIYRGE